MEPKKGNRGGESDEVSKSSSSRSGSAQIYGQVERFEGSVQEGGASELDLLRQTVRSLEEIESRPDEGVGGDAEEVMCSYREYDPESGDMMACGKPAHGPKVKHGSWGRVS